MFPRGALGYAYTPIILFSLLLFWLAIIAAMLKIKNIPIAEVVNGSAVNLVYFFAVLIISNAIGIGVMEIIFNVSNIATLLGVAASPTGALTSTGTQTLPFDGMFGALLTLFLYSIVGVSTEVFTFTSTLLPTFIKSLKNPAFVSGFSFVGALVFYFLFNLLSIAIIFIIVIVGTLLIVTAIFGASKLANKEIEIHPALRIIIAMLIVATMFGLWHYHVFSTSQYALPFYILIGAAMLFYIGATTLSILADCIYPSLIIQCANDASIIIVLFSLSFWYAPLMMGIMDLIAIFFFIIRNKKGAITNNAAMVT